MKGLTDAVYFFSPCTDLVLVADKAVIALLQELLVLIMFRLRKRVSIKRSIVEVGIKMKLLVFGC